VNLFVRKFLRIFDERVISCKSMETLILKSNSKRDVKLLVDIAKKLGMDLKVADRRDLVLAEALRLNKSVKKNRVPLSEIVDECNVVREELHQDVRKNNS